MIEILPMNDDDQQIELLIEQMEPFVEEQGGAFRLEAGHLALVYGVLTGQLALPRKRQGDLTDHRDEWERGPT